MIVYYDSKLAATSPAYLAHLRIIYDQLKYDEPIRRPYTSRYTATRVIENGSKSYYESPNKTDIPESEADVYVTTDKTNENRLDIISNKVYGTPLQWWVIALANNIHDPFEISLGTTLRIPNISSIFGVKGLMRR